jgi:hypothetical protein
MPRFRAYTEESRHVSEEFARSATVTPLLRRRARVVFVTVSGVIAATGMVTVGMLAAAPAALALPGCAPPPPAVTSYTANQAGVYTVPNGITTENIVAAGSEGSVANNGAAVGGLGASVTSDVTVTPGDALSVAASQSGTVGVGGQSGAAPSGGSSGTVQGVTGGGGGGASVVSDGSTVLVAAGGGGGAAYGYSQAAGGDAAPGGTAAEPAGTVSPGADGGDSTTEVGAVGGTGGRGATSSPGAGGAGGAGYGGPGSPGSGEVGGDAGIGGGGGGGGGYAGGGGGGYGALMGGGGAGSSYSTNDYTIQPSEGDGSVTITYVVPNPYLDGVPKVTFPTQQAATFTVCTAATPTASINEAGTLPTGVSFLDNGDGTATLAGTAAAGTEGVYPLTFMASNGNGTPATQSFTLIVGTSIPAVSVTGAPTSSTFGDPVTFTAQIDGASGGSVPTGTVDFTADGAAISPACTSAPVSTSLSVTTATCTTSTLTAGSDSVAATYSGDTDYTSGQVGTATYVVDKAGTLATISVQPTTITATVTAVAPGAGTPTGLVTFSVGGISVGTAALTSGTATLTYSVPSGSSRNVAAIYAGDANFTGASASTSRSDPSLIATVTSAHPKTTFGWYRTPVTVHFTCLTDGAALTGACPAAVTVSRSAGGQSVARTITTTNGGAATVVVSPINVDRVKPRATVTGVRNRAVYDAAAPARRCVAHDALSGVASCSVRTTSKSKAPTTLLTTIHYTVSATDRAGNVATARGSYEVAGFFVKGARLRRGAFAVKAGHHYTVGVVSATRPRFFEATSARSKHPTPFVPGPRMKRAGHDLWTVRISITAAMRNHGLWRLGTRTKATLHIIQIRIAP